MIMYEDNQTPNHNDLTMSMECEKRSSPPSHDSIHCTVISRQFPHKTNACSGEAYQQAGHIFHIDLQA